MDFTEEQLTLIDEANALREMQGSHGWKILQERVKAALDATDWKLLALPLETGDGAAFPPEIVGREYLRLRHIANGIKAIQNEVTNTIRRADKLVEKANPSTK